ncbi:MAG TPA: IS4 family transposase [Pyrinomonadaceae bacterium]|nr:IS4 family transposase [Pyrinomonadaceae bacterium]
MADLRPLERTLAENVTWNKARINFLAKFLVALVQVKTINLVQVSSVMSGRAKQASHYKRIQRFLRFFQLPFAELARFVIALIGLRPPFTITIDRTDWYLGETPLNVLLLGIAFQGISFPLLWTILEKKGCSDTNERIALMQDYLRLFGRQSIEFICADREFIGVDWLAFLCRERIPFRLRLKENLLVENSRHSRRVAARNLFRTQKAGQAVLLRGARQVLGQRLFVMGMRRSDGEYVIVGSREESDLLLRDYARRWGVETLFGCLKTRGFCLEATHVTDKERLRKLIALMALAFCWAYLTGQWLTQVEPLKIKKHGRLAKSIFRHGFDHLRRILCNQDCLVERFAFIRLSKLLSCT